MIVLAPSAVVRPVELAFHREPFFYRSELTDEATFGFALSGSDPSACPETY